MILLEDESAQKDDLSRFFYYIEQKDKLLEAHGQD